jgi:hypothetical protein
MAGKTECWVIQTVLFTATFSRKGGALIFSVNSQWHDRNRIPRQLVQDFAHLGFFQYVPTGWKPLAYPENWIDIFGVQGF